ncbi:MAG: ATP-binding protein [Candidatus Levyibacteriota bacterium]
MSKDTQEILSLQAVRSIFESVPGLYLILKPNAPTFTIVAVSDAYVQATMTKREEILGKSLFEVFPDNPDDPNATGVKNLTTSLLTVLKQQQPHKMAIQKYDIRKPKKEGGGFEVRYWSPLNSPVFDEKGNISYLIHSVVDVTQLVQAEKREKAAEKKVTELQLLYSELLLAQKQLQESEQRLTNMLESVTDGFVSYDKDWRYVYVNEKAAEMSGTKKEDLIGKTLFELYPNRIDTPLFQEYRRVMSEGKPKQLEYFSPGAKRWIRTNLYPSSQGMTSFITDITDRKQAEERQNFLEEISSKLVKSFDNAVTLQEIGKLIITYLADYCRIVVIDDTNRIREISVNHTDPTKVSLVRSLYDNYKDLSDMAYGIPRILKTGKPEIIKKIDKKILAPVKKYTTLLKTVKQIGLKSYMGVPLIARGKIIGAITFSSVSEHRYYTKQDLKFVEELAHRIALVLDNVRLFGEAQGEIKERKQAELNLKYLAEASKMLSSSLDYKTTLSNIAKLAVPKIADWCAVDLLNGKGGLEQVAVAHKDPQKVRWAKELRKIDPPDLNAPTGIPHVIRTGKSEYYPVITDKTLVQIAKNKKQLKLLRDIGFTSAIVAPLCREGRCIGGITFVTTETKRHFTEADLRMAEELANRASIALENAGLYQASQDAIMLRDNFISVASHELKTPITSVKIFTQVMQEHSKQIGDLKALNNLTKMNKQLDKMTELIYNMLNISKIQAGRLEFSQKLFAFDTLVKEIVDVLQQGAVKHKIVIDGHTNSTIYGDEDRIGQVLSNLIANALKYSPKSDEIIVHLSSDDNDVTVCVEDFGIGMAKEHFDHIFERFYRVFDTTDKTFPGLGIGLYISSEIIHRHHGKLWVESTTGKGSKFYFSLPLKRDKKPNGIQIL